MVHSGAECRASQRTYGRQWKQDQVPEMIRVEIKPELLRWARERSGLDPGALAQRFPHLDTWERRESSPTLKQLESFAKATHTPVGYLFLQEPPFERVPIPDFR